MFAQISAAGYDGIELNLDAPDSSAHSLYMDTAPDKLASIRELSEKYSFLSTASPRLYTAQIRWAQTKALIAKRPKTFCGDMWSWPNLWG